MTNLPTPSGSVPHFVVAGAGRAGTTAVIEALRAHPSIFVTQPKEPHYLALGDQFTPFTGPGDDVTINRAVIADRDRYLRLYDGAEGRVTGEGSVSTLYYYDASIPRLQSLNHDVRVIIILRDPVERAQSAFQYLTARGWEKTPTLIEAAQLEDFRVAARWHHLWHYRRMSIYSAGVSAFRETFGVSQVGVWFHEDIAAAGPRVITEMLAFLGVRPDDWDASSLKQVNVSGVPRSRLLQRAIRGAGANPHVRETLKNVVPFHARERLRRANLRPVSVQRDERRYFGDTFAADAVQLEHCLGRPIPWAT